MITPSEGNNVVLDTGMVVTASFIALLNVVLALFRADSRSVLAAIAEG